MLDQIITYDIETYPNIFTLAAERVSTGAVYTFELSEWVNESEKLIQFLKWIKENNFFMCGYNNLNFDYPVIHTFMKNIHNNYPELYAKADFIINGERPKYGHSVTPWEVIIPQLDLLKIHHYDNKSRATSLKYLEFVMEANNIQDLPCEPGVSVPESMRLPLLQYNVWDVKKTTQFLKMSMDKIEFRKAYVEKWNDKRVWNFSDVKIGAEIFKRELEKHDPNSCIDPRTKQKRQTVRNHIDLEPLIFDYIKFDDPGFNEMLSFVQGQRITETKGVFKNLVTDYKGVRVKFGLGGIHASVNRGKFERCSKRKIIDIDVKSYYPNICIKNRLHPAHLSEELFVGCYSNLYDERGKYKKGTPENSAIKLGLNGAYGGTNDKWSFLYDPRVTMTVTLNGQFSLCMLAERLTDNTSAELIQMNTDGITIIVDSEDESKCRDIVKKWEDMTKLTMEFAEYDKMFVRDVNSYLAVGVDGKVKRIGAYKTRKDLQFHQNHSQLVVPAIAERVLVNGACAINELMSYDRKLDFLLCSKVPRRGYLTHDGDRVQRISRYLVTNEGGPLVKYLPKKDNPEEMQATKQAGGNNVTIWNDLDDGFFTFNLDINYRYYYDEVIKLTEGF